MSAMERKLVGKGKACVSKFWAYLGGNKKMIGKCMWMKPRCKARMPRKDDGDPLRCYTNQSESINTVLTRQK